MNMAGWYTRLPVPRRKADRLRETLRYSQDGGRNRKALTIRHEKLCFFKAYSRSVFIQGYKAKVCSRYHIAKFFGVPLSTVHNWHKHNVLPEPFMQLDGPHGPYPVFLSAQLRILLVVVRDLVLDGYVSIPWQRLPDHVAMLHRGYAAALKSFNKRAGHEAYDGEGDRFGVVLLD